MAAMLNQGLVVLGIALLGVAGCQTAGLAPSASVTTTSPGVTESRFKLDWSTTANGQNQQTVEGHIENV